MSAYKLIFGLLNLIGLFKISQQEVSSRQSKSYGDFVRDVNIKNCKSGKNVLTIHTGATRIFHFNETEKTSLRYDDFECHYELEVRKDIRHKYGFFVYIDEMHLNGKQGNCGEDYIRFEGDGGLLGAVTNRKSKKFCGKKYPQKPSTPWPVENSRVYIDSVEGEMDVKVKIKSKKSSLEPRYLKMTITSYKKFCKSDDLYYQSCGNHKNSNCIRKDLFCDGLTNCPFYDFRTIGSALDEENCPPPESSKGSNPNILVLILCSLAATAMGIIIVVFIYKCVKHQRQRMRTNAMVRTSQDRVNTRADNPRPDTTDSGSTTNRLTSYQEPPSDSPPTYEKAIEENPGLLSRGTPLAPPSYSEALIADQSRSELSHA